MMTYNKPTDGINIMRGIERVTVTAMASICMLGSTMAAELTGEEIRKLISGSSLYLELAASNRGTQGLGIIYYDPLGAALYKTPEGVIWHGKWKIVGNTACINWKESPHNPCTKYDKRGDTIATVNVATGVTRAKVTKIVPGNAEKLTP